MKLKLKTLLIKTIFSLMALLSLKNCHRFGRALGWLYLIIPNRPSHVTKVNIKLCFPTLNDAQQKI